MGSLDFDRLVRELNIRIADYGGAFSSKSVSRVLTFYKANALLELHQLGGDRTGKGGSGRNVRAYTGGFIGALLRGALPAAFLFGIAFRRLAKRGYASSELRLLGVKPISDTEVRILAHFERKNGDGAIFESSEVVYRLERIAGVWLICEGWLFDNREQAVALGLDTFQSVPREREG